MDSNTLTSAGLSAGSISIVLIIYTLLKYVCGKKIISDCCKRNYEVGIQVKNFDSPTGTSNSKPFITNEN